MKKEKERKMDGKREKKKEQEIKIDGKKKVRNEYGWIERNMKKKERLNDGWKKARWFAWFVGSLDNYCQGALIAQVVKQIDLVKNLVVVSSNPTKFPFLL